MQHRFRNHRSSQILGGIISLLLLLVSGSVQGEERPLERFEYTQIRMGVAVRITVFTADEETAKRASDAAYARIKELDLILSDYDPDSEVNQLCQSPAGHPVRVSDELFHMLTVSEEYWKSSQGLFDPTVGPLVKLWRVARRSKVLPPQASIENALKRTGFQNVTLDHDIQTVTLAQSGMQLDFGGIGKGYAAEEAYRVLTQHRVPIALVAVSGEIRAGDPPPHRTGWTVEIEQRGTSPEEQSKHPLTIVVANQAVSTSGDTYQFVEIDGKRYSHILDPVTGLGMTTSSSVTIVADNSTKADALATIVTLLGATEGIAFLEDFYPQVNAYIVTIDADQKPVTAATSAWSKLISPVGTLSE